ncbi:MAG: hypothetical protein OQL19_00550 [Gammaproteobacteria bacterium]|nr:hypothetical protein [Gammaproteobacteria bacterium]
MTDKLIFSLFLFIQVPMVWAQVSATYTLTSAPICSSDESLVVISGKDIPQIIGNQVKNLSLVSFKQGNKQAIVFQIDQKDSQDRYIFKNNSVEKNESLTVFDHFDELVLRKKDLGERWDMSSNPFKKDIKSSLFIEIEIKIKQENTGQNNSGQKETSGWLYIIQNEAVSFQDKAVVYNSKQDSIISPLYKMVFSKEKPFLLNAFHWRMHKPSSELFSMDSEWSPDATDTMKIRHIGKFFGFSFKRTDDDYYSQLVDVKKGPLRVIRRTENKVKVFWKLKSPALYIDYVMMPDGFVMDSMIDIPFNISFFFSELATMTTMDWNNEFEGQNLIINTDKAQLDLPVNGKTSDDKKAFNEITATNFSVDSKLGKFDVMLDLPEDFPIHSQLFLKDALNEIDLPENHPGQFGNVGFKTTGWEKIDSKLHHLRFTVCVDKM